jgi:hypothetical protein
MDSDVELDDEEYDDEDSVNHYSEELKSQSSRSHTGDEAGNSEKGTNEEVPIRNGREDSPRRNTSPDSASSSQAIAPPAVQTEPIVDEHEFLINGPATRIGRKRRTKDVLSMIRDCVCGVSVRDDEGAAIKCKRTGCETGWVSAKCQDTPHSLIWSLVPPSVCRTRV